MSSKVFFYNPGYFDPVAMVTVGVNVKENDNSIGRFGTGFKYAVAIVLRLGGTIEVKTRDPEGNTHYFKFETQRKAIRGKDFDVVHVNDIPAGFTTHYGIGWEPWMAYRELFCNAKDEGGGVKVLEYQQEVSELMAANDTVITVDCAKIVQAHMNRDQYFLDTDNMRKAEEMYQLDIYNTPSANIYYQGVAVASFDKPALKSYNFRAGVDITEDRMAKNKTWLLNVIAMRVCYSNNSDLIYEFLTAKDGTAEAALTFDRTWDATETFLECCALIMRQGRRVNDSARELYVYARRMRDEFEECELSPLEKKTIEHAKDFIRRALRIDIDDFPVIYTKNLGELVLGRAIKGKIYISELAFQAGTKQVASTLLEEWVHLKTGADDFDRKMQNWLFDRILATGAELIGEPL